MNSLLTQLVIFFESIKIFKQMISHEAVIRISRFEDLIEFVLILIFLKWRINNCSAVSRVCWKFEKFK